MTPDKIKNQLLDYYEQFKANLGLFKSFEVICNYLNFIKSEPYTKSLLGEAIEYTINQWDYLKNYTLDGRLDIDNNRTERAIKPFVVGRKAWLFSNTPKGANSSAILYSIVETAKENRLKPYDYMKYLLDQIPNLNDLSSIDQLLPWSDTIPKEIRL